MTNKKPTRAIALSLSLSLFLALSDLIWRSAERSINNIEIRSQSELSPFG